MRRYRIVSGRRVWSSILLGLALAACSLDPGAGITEAGQACSAIRAPAAQTVDAALGCVEGLLEGDPQECAAQFLELARLHPGVFGSRTFSCISSRLPGEWEYVNALDTLTNGLPGFGSPTTGLSALNESARESTGP